MDIGHATRCFEERTLAIVEWLRCGSTGMIPILLFRTSVAFNGNVCVMALSHGSHLFRVKWPCQFMSLADQSLFNITRGTFFILIILD